MAQWRIHKDKFNPLLHQIAQEPSPPHLWDFMTFAGGRQYHQRRRGAWPCCCPQRRSHRYSPKPVPFISIRPAQNPKILGHRWPRGRGHHGEEPGGRRLISVPLLLSIRPRAPWVVGRGIVPMPRQCRRPICQIKNSPSREKHFYGCFTPIKSTFSNPQNDSYYIISNLLFETKLLFECHCFMFSG